MEQLLRGVRVGMEPPIHAMITQIRGDWKWQRETWKLVGP